MSEDSTPDFPSFTDQDYGSDEDHVPDVEDSFPAADPAPVRRATAGLADVRAHVPTLPQWRASDYHLEGSGAAKLADSGVAPLVAAARGYKTVGVGNFAEEMKRMSVKMITKQGKRFKETLNVQGQDGMQMPWYSAADIQIANRDGKPVTPFTYQIRPSHPADNEHGKPIKYEFLPNVGTPLDIHPATPLDWIDTTPKVMFAEGMLKGDSALSAYLHAQGVEYQALASEGIEDPAARLRELMNAIPHEDRVLIISIAGINNTSQHPADWREIALKGREGWIAFDADLADNRFVYQAAVDLHRRLDEKSKMSRVLFLNPQIVGGDGGEMAKAGVDDYLAKVGTWHDLVRMITPKLPEPPRSSAEEVPGNWRISKDGLFTEECSAVNDGPGGQLSGYTWNSVLDLGGRILGLEARRQPTDQELRSGLFNENVGSSDVEEAEVQIEVTWTRDGHDSKVIVTGPKSILNYSPVDWDRKGADIPDPLLLHPSWPPRGAKGDSWLSAIKACRGHETEHTTRWLQMGWVPVAGREPVFLIGDQVIGDPDVAVSAVAGIDESNLGVAPHFGVGTDIDGEWEDEAYREKVRSDISAVIRAYIDDEPWTDPSTAALVLAVALRPAIPLRPRTTCYLWGPKGRGKSWTAQAMMYFWSRNKSDWQDRLPGSAKDTFAFLEMVVSQTPIWVVDDLAPSTSKRQSENETAKLEDLTRAIFNNASKGRMNADMTSRKVNKPISQLIITAENELTTPSAKERLIPAYIGAGKLNPSNEPTDAINAMALDHGVQARLTAHFLKYIRRTAVNSAGGWESFMASLGKSRQGLQEVAKKLMIEMGAPKGSLERTTSLAADVMLTFEVLKDMANELGMERSFVKRLENGPEGLGRRLVELVNNAHADNQNSSPGRSLVRALSGLLAAGGGHIISGEDPSRPPFTATAEGDSMVNHRLGWAPAGGGNGELRPCGPTIGTMLEIKGEKVILFDADTAFSKAQDAYPSLIAYGQGTGSAWASIWDEGIAPSFIPRRKNSRGTNVSTYRSRIGNSRICGVPIEVNTIISGSLTVDDLADNSDDD